MGGTRLKPPGGDGVLSTSNVGGGAGLALALIDTDAPFKSIIVSGALNIIVNPDDITLGLDAITNANLALGVFTNITGLGVQTQELDMDGNRIVMTPNGLTYITSPIDDIMGFIVDGSSTMNLTPDSMELLEDLNVAIPRNINVLGGNVTLTSGNLNVINGIVDMGGNTIVMDADGDTTIDASVDDEISFVTGGTEILKIDNSLITVGKTINLQGNTIQLVTNGNTFIGSFFTDDNIFFITGPTPGTRLHINETTVRVASGVDFFMEGGDIDLNGGTLILDADADTSIASVVDDKIDFVVGGATIMDLEAAGLDMFLPINMQDNTIIEVGALISGTANSADAEKIRLAVTDSMAWRNNANDGNLLLGINASDELNYQGSVLTGLFDASNTTGIISGDLPVPSATVGSVDLSAMKLLFVNHDDLNNPIRKVVDIPAQTLADPLVVSETVTRLWVDEFGGFAWTSFVTELDRRDWILLGTPNHFDNVNITNVATGFKIQNNNEGWLTVDLTDMLGLIKTGMSVTGRGGDLGIDIGTGRVFLRTANQQSDNNSQNIIVYAVNTLQPALNHHIRTGQTISTSNFLEPTLWDNNGVEATVANNEFTNIRIWIFPLGTNSLFAITQRGQKEYNNLAEAEAGAVVDSYVLNPILEANDIGLAIISIKKEATSTTPDGSTVSILNVNKFGFIGNAGGAGGGGVPQSPILQNIDYAGFNASNFGTLSFTDTDTSIFQNGINLLSDVATSGLHVLRVNNVNEYTFGETDADWQGNNLIDLSNLEFRDSVAAPASTAYSMFRSGLPLVYNVPIGASHFFKVGNVNKYQFTTTQADWLGNNIINMNNILFQNTGATPAITEHAIWADTLGLSHNVPTGKEINFQINGTEEFEITAAAVDVKGNNINNFLSLRQTGTIPSSGAIRLASTSQIRIQDDFGGASGFIEYDDNDTWLIGNSDTLEYEFGSTFANFRSNDLINVNRLQFNSADTDTYIWNDGTLNDIKFVVGNSTLQSWTDNGTNSFSQFAGRVQQSKGADVTSATTLVLGDGNVFLVLGTTEIETIDATDWQAGSEITLQFNLAVTIKEMIGNIFLTGAVDHTTIAGEIIKFFYTGSFWTQMTTNVPPGGGATDLNSLADVTISGFTINDLLVSDSEGTWVNRQGVFTGITGLGVQTQILDMGGFDIHGINDISFATVGQGIDSSATGMVFGVPTGDLIGFSIDGNVELLITPTEINIDSNNVADIGSLISDDAAPASTGFVKMGDNQSVSWRNNSDTLDVSLTFDTNDEFVFNSNGFTNTLSLEADHASPVNGTTVSILKFVDDNSIGDRTTYGRIQVNIEDPANGAEDGEMFLNVEKAGIPKDYLAINQANSDQVDILVGLNMNNQTLQNALFVESNDANPSSAGFVRMGVVGDVGWRNNANDGNLLLSVNASDQLTFDGVLLETQTTTIALAEYTNTDTTTNINPVAIADIPIVGTQKFLDSDFSAPDGSTLRTLYAGRVRLSAVIYYTGAVVRATPEMRFRKNGTAEGPSATGYVRNSTAVDASSTLEWTTDCAVNDDFTISSIEGPVSGTVTMPSGKSMFKLERVG